MALRSGAFYALLAVLVLPPAASIRDSYDSDSFVSKWEDTKDDDVRRVMIGGTLKPVDDDYEEMRPQDEDPEASSSSTPNRLEPGYLAKIIEQVDDWNAIVQRIHEETGEEVGEPGLFPLESLSVLRAVVPTVSDGTGAWNDDERQRIREQNRKAEAKRDAQEFQKFRPNNIKLVLHDYFPPHEDPKAVRLGWVENGVDKLTGQTIYSNSNLSGEWSMHPPPVALPTGWNIRVWDKDGLNKNRIYYERGDQIQWQPPSEEEREILYEGDLVQVFALEDRGAVDRRISRWATVARVDELYRQVGKKVKIPQIYLFAALPPGWRAESRPNPDGSGRVRVAYVHSDFGLWSWHPPPQDGLPAGCQMHVDKGDKHIYYTDRHGGSSLEPPSAVAASDFGVRKEVAAYDAKVRLWCLARIVGVKGDTVSVELFDGPDRGSRINDIRYNDATMIHHNPSRRFFLNDRLKEAALPDGARRVLRSFVPRPTEQDIAQGTKFLALEAGDFVKFTELNQEWAHGIKLDRKTKLEVGESGWFPANLMSSQAVWSRAPSVKKAKRGDTPEKDLYVSTRDVEAVRAEAEAVKARLQGSTGSPKGPASPPPSPRATEVDEMTGERLPIEKYDH